MRKHFGKVLLAAVLAGGVPAYAAAQMTPGMQFPMTPEPQSRFNRGNYFLAKGEQAFKRGRLESARNNWDISAYWGHKIAQYNLGLMYFKGVGVTVDRPRGVAWLALAAERGDAPLENALEWAYAQLTPAEVDYANKLWRDELKPRYADAVAMPRAMSLWRMDLVTMTGSHLGHTIGNMTVLDFANGETIDGMLWQRKLHEAGGPYPNPIYPRVEVGDLVPLEKRRK